MSEKTPLFSALDRRAEKNALRFHMPGHKGKRVFPGRRAEELDFTELSDTGEAYEGSGPFLETNRLFAADFGAKSAFLTAGGSTLCIQAMLFAAFAGSGRRKLILSRAAHKSVYDAMALLDIEPVFFEPGLPGAAPFEKIGAGGDGAALSEAIPKEPGAGAVFLTSPSYYGVCRETEGLAKIAHEGGIPLLADCAHGAHFPYIFENWRTQADMAAHSLHKTLCALGGAALLTAGDGDWERELARGLGIFGSSSPSYAVMASADLARARAKSDKKALAGLCAVTSAVQKGLAEKTAFVPLTQEHLAPGLFPDPLRLTVNTAAGGVFGTDCASALERAGIACEMADRENIVFIITGADTEAELKALEDGLVRVFEAHGGPAKPPVLPGPGPLRRELPLAQALRARTERVRLGDCAERVLAAHIYITPPCVPAALAGEVPGRELVEYLIRTGFDPDAPVSVVGSGA